jgi:tetratricopeptide (TPR) repeat protein
MKKKGFGKSQPSIKEAKKFILAFQDCGVKNKGDKAKCEQFLKDNLSKLDESLLEALPLVFRDLTANKLSKEREAFASTFGNFALLINNFSLNGKSLNKELSIVAFNLALKIWSSQEFPEYWAMAQLNLGAAYCERVKGEKADNLEIAINCSHEALKVYSFTAFPQDWARTQNNLGLAYKNRVRGELADNLEIAITHYQEALKVDSFTAFPQDWARTQNNLGTAYSDRIRGERADNLETAIAYYQEALKVRTLNTFPQDWARTQMNLGLAYWSRIRGERADNLEIAITYSQEALKVYTYDAFSQDWAAIQNNLAIIYLDRIRGERIDNLEKAISYCKEALKLRTIDTYPEDWAMLTGNLGLAYHNRILGGRTDNLEQAIALHKSTLQVYNCENIPEHWARTQHNLANAYCDRLLGKLIDNIEIAISFYEQAALVFTRESIPLKWAENQGHLAEALIKKASLTSNLKDLDTAIFLLQEALKVSAPNSPDFIDNQYRLGDALACRGKQNKNPHDLKQSLEAHTIAYDAISPEHYDRQKYWKALPATQAILGSYLVRDGRWQEGLQLLINSLNQLKTGDNSLVYANALYQTGYAYELLSDQENARLYYRDALRLYEHLQDLPGIATSRESLGNVFVSQGHLEKGMSELAQAREIYQQLGQTEAAEKVDNTYQSVQQVWKQVKSEVLA